MTQHNHSTEDGDETLWVDRPRSERMLAAELFAGIGLDALALSMRAFNALRRSGWYEDVAKLMLAGEEIWYVRSLGGKSIREIEAALAPLFQRGTDIVPTPMRDDDEQFERALRSLAELADYDTQPWFTLPLELRFVLAKRFSAQPIERLGLDLRALKSLRFIPSLRTVGALIGVGDVRSLGSRLDEATMRGLHDGLIHLARDVIAEIDANERWHAALAALSRREDLADQSLGDIGWPDHLLALCLGDTVQGLTLMDRGYAEHVWSTLAKQPFLRDELLMAVELLAGSPTGLEHETWTERWRSMGLTVIPDGFVVGGRMTLSEAVTATLRHVVVSRLGEQDWSILQHRYELGGADRLPVRELGQAYGITRARVRQRGSRALNVVRQWLGHPAMHRRSTRWHPAVSRCLHELDRLLAEVRHTPIVGDRFQQRAAAILAAEGGGLDPLVPLLASLRGVAEIDFDRKGLASVWASDDPSIRTRIRLRVTQLHDQLAQRSALPLTDVELAAAIIAEARNHARITVQEIQEHVDLCSSVERRPDGRLQGRLESLTRVLQVERILREAGEPLHIVAILRSLNRVAASGACRPINRQYLGNRLSSNGRFVPIGRSGYWALTEWDDVETGTVVGLMERCLVEHDRPMTIEELYVWIVERRQASANSIPLYLTMNDRFAKLDGDTWGLARWAPHLGKQPTQGAPMRRSSAKFVRVRDFVRQALGDRPGRDMPLAELRSLAIRELGIPGASVYHYVGHIEELTTYPRTDGPGKMVRWTMPVDDGNDPSR